ncbi:glutathione S-transferase T3-like protein [Tanacetum coccineum]
MKSGMSMKDVELDAHKIYEGDGSKFLDLTVFNEVMCKHPKWMLNIDRDNTRSRPIDEEPNEESGGSTKRSRTSEEGEYVVHSNQETPNSGGSTIQRPIGRDAAKKKGKGKASQSFSSAEFVEELRAMRITRESEIEVMNKRLEVDKKREEREIKREERELKREERELKKEERKTKKMYLLHLNALLAKDHLSPEDEDMKRNLYEMLYGK